MSAAEIDTIEAIDTRATQEAIDTRATQERTEADLARSRLQATREQPLMAAATLGAIAGKVVAVQNGGRTAFVRYRGQPGTAALSARTVVDLSATHIGCEVFLLFEQGDPERPVIMGLLREGVPARRAHVQVHVDGDGLIIDAEQQVTIRCGKASITLTAAGKVLIEGEYVISRARRTNRIEGGGVQIN